MRQIVATLVVLAIGAPALGGDTVLYSNNVIQPVDGPGGLQYRDGPFSDAMLSGGTYYRSQAFGQTFRILSDNTAVTRLRIWGSSETTSTNPAGLTALDPNINALQVSVYRYSTTTNQFPLVSAQPIVIPIAQVVQQRTDTYVPGITTPVFQLDMDLSAFNLSLGSGDYMISVGGKLTDSGNAPAFIWINGQRDGRNQAIGDQARFTRGEIAAQWGIWRTITNAPTSGSMVLYGIPAPGAITALLLAGARGNRRRRG